jgi:hypothetical protein
VVGVTLAPVPLAAHVTDVPCCGAPLSVTNTRSGFGSSVLTSAVWPSPLALAVWAIAGDGGLVPSPLLHPGAASGASAIAAPSHT